MGFIAKTERFDIFPERTHYSAYLVTLCAIYRWRALFILLEASTTSTRRRRTCLCWPHTGLARPSSSVRLWASCGPVESQPRGPAVDSEVTHRDPEWVIFDPCSGLIWSTTIVGCPEAAVLHSRTDGKTPVSDSPTISACQPQPPPTG